MADTMETTKLQVAATLAAALITASKRPHSIEQALKITRDIQFALNTNPQAGAHKEWEKAKDTTLQKVHD
jgi:hypothetical protein